MAEKPKFDVIEIARRLVRTLNVKRLSAGGKPQLLSYDTKTGLYILGDNPIELRGQRLIGQRTKIYHVGEILDAVRRNSPLIGASEINNPQHSIIVFKNGVLDLS